MNLDFDSILPRFVHDARAILRKSATKAQLLERRWNDAPPELAGMLRETIAAQAELDLFFRRFGAFREAVRATPGDPMPAATVVQLAYLARRERATASGGAVEVGDMGDFAVPSSMQSVVQELLDNAISYAVPERPLRVSIRAQSDDEHVRIIVEDNGSGWNPTLSEKIFLPLERLDSRGGFGLGLAIAKALVENAGGTIVGDTNSAGSIFTIELPRTIEHTRSN